MESKNIGIRSLNSSVTEFYTMRKQTFEQLKDGKSLRRDRRDLDQKKTVPTSVNLLKGKKQCELCHQSQPEIVEIPIDANLEEIVLSNEILANVYTDELDVIQHNLINYSIYDENGHMCSIDSGALERNVPLYVCGYVKPIYDHSPGGLEGIAARNLGPICEWWLSSYDEGSHALIGITTDYAHYLLIEPQSDYEKYMTSVTEKINLSKIVIETIIDYQNSDNPTYGDILNYIVNSVNQTTGNKFTEEYLITHAQFVLDQVVDYDLNDSYHLPLGDTQFIETLTELTGAVKKDDIKSRELLGARRKKRCLKIIDEREFCKATTTELVRDAFENMLAVELDENNKNEETSDNLCKNVFNDICSEEMMKELFFMNCEDKNKFIWNCQIPCKQMFVLVKDQISTVPFIGRIEYLFEENLKDKAHITLFMHGYETVLGEASDPQELFALKKCTNIDLINVVKVLDVSQKIPRNNWFNLGNSKLKELLEPVNRNSKKSFFYQLQYDDELGRFEYPKHTRKNIIDHYCRICEAEVLEKELLTPEPLELIQTKNGITYYYKLKFKKEEYKIGSFIYLQPGTFSLASKANFTEDKPFKHPVKNKNNQLLQDVDECKYPEYYRKTLENTMRSSNETTPDAFEIAEILAIYIVEGDMKNVQILVRRMYRSEQIPLDDNYKNADMNMLFWSEEEFGIRYDNICGKCYVAFILNILDPLAWSAGGPDRFYFSKKYDFITGTLIPDYQLPSTAKLTGKEVYVNYEYQYVDENKLQYIPCHKKIRPLRALDIFAGCGGLSKGLEESGLIISKWAVESDDKAAAAYELNNPGSTVFVDDCNRVLELAMSGCIINNKKQKIPRKGEVDFICGGPPCQGFSGMNRFNSGQYSLFKNSLIVSLLSYIDYYRPRYFVIENVKDFVSFKRSMVLKLTLRCITRMGYQCTFGVLQAGNFGVPQSRRRLIIMAAAPGEQLPLYPEPLHVFNRNGSSLTVQVGNKQFKTNCKYDESAPMRTVTVYDAWSDLPEISNGADEEDLLYKSIPITHFQRVIRHPYHGFSASILTDHICKDMSPLVQARMELIPVGEGSDWRDLPNIEVKLSDGTMTNKLLYSHHDIKNGKAHNGSLRGVCQCASGMKCNPQDCQSNTIIPWCLSHTGNRQNHWAGLYGRLAWTGFCSTITTNPEPMGTQGRVLHPEQNRVVSVRECARSQGFKDSYLFYGSIIDKHRQIGNAVPPPMGTAIGHAIIKSILSYHV